MDEKISMGKGEEISFRIPEELSKQFGKELRIMIRPGPTTGIWNPDPETLAKIMKTGILKDFDIIISPKQIQK